jgi:hypothetical protein
MGEVDSVALPAPRGLVVKKVRGETVREVVHPIQGPVAYESATGSRGSPCFF